MPLDFEILKRLPEKGVIGGIHWQGRRVKDLREEIIRETGLDDPSILPTSLIQARLRSMHVAGYVENFPASAGGVVIWARSHIGTEQMNRGEEILGGG